MSLLPAPREMQYMNKKAVLYPNGKYYISFTRRNIGYVCDNGSRIFVGYLVKYFFLNAKHPM